MDVFCGGEGFLFFKKHQTCACICTSMWAALSNISVTAVNRINAFYYKIQGGSNMTGTDLCVNKAHCAAAVRP